MRLPLRHPPPADDPPHRRCAHLDALAAACVGLPLAGTARRLSSRRSRGRHGTALQWHLGLAAHDSDARLDWEDRIEIKLVSVWRRPDRTVACDKLKVCEITVDPWAKLANVLWVFADRLTRVVVAARPFHLAGAVRSRLANAWQADPHFGEPDLFVEAREQAGRAAPAYYLAARWFRREGLLPPAGPGVLPFDAKWWSQARDRGGGRDPLPTIATDPAGRQSCRRCGGPITFDPEAVEADDWAPAHHGLPHAGDCALTAHFAVAPGRLRMPTVLPPQACLSALEQLATGPTHLRLFDQVPEPDDHAH
jgi:hypothetical protein